MNATTQQRQIVCEDGVISYQLTRKKVKNVNLRIRPDGTVLVSANCRVPVSFIDDFIRQKQELIFSALAKYQEKRESHQEAPKQYISGESYTLFGKLFLL